ncbi:hypothetical protein Hanom_Chr07g00627141 [Helianthus anomalus]
MKNITTNCPLWLALSTLRVPAHSQQLHLKTLPTSRVLFSTRFQILLLPDKSVLKNVTKEIKATTLDLVYSVNTIKASPFPRGNRQ